MDASVCRRKSNPESGRQRDALTALSDRAAATYQSHASWEVYNRVPSSLVADGLDRSDSVAVSI